jgi:serine/threonine protein phosphatase 1
LIALAAVEHRQVNTFQMFGGNMSESYIVVGDVHGCMPQLNEVIAACKSYSNHRYVFLGDYIDRGPYSNEVIDIIRTIDAICLKGNHEQSLLRYYAGLHEGKAATDNPKVPVLSDENRKWIGNCLQLYHETENYIFVHAGLDQDHVLPDQDETDLLWKISQGSYDKLLPKLVFHGHKRVEKVEKEGNRYNINTGCGFGGPLTAFILPEMKSVQSSASERYSSGNLQSLREEMESLLSEEAELEDA